MIPRVSGAERQSNIAYFQLNAAFSGPLKAYVFERFLKSHHS